MIKIVTIDLDGTLFDNNKNISQRNLNAIKRCKELGVKIVISTGRPYKGVYPILKKLDLISNDDYAIIYNGSKIINTGTNEKIFFDVIYGSTVKELYEIAKKYDLNIHAFRLNEELITPKHNQYTDVEARINKIEDHIYDFNQIKDDDVFIKCMIVDDENKLDNLVKVIDKKYYEEYTMVRSSKIFLEFLNKSSNKGKALKHLREYLNVDRIDTMAIGDAGNDVSMLDEAYVSVAMDNAFEYVFEHAKYRTASNINSGVAIALEKFIINKGN